MKRLWSWLLIKLGLKKVPSMGSLEINSSSHGQCSEVNNG